MHLACHNVCKKSLQKVIILVAVLLVPQKSTFYHLIGYSHSPKFDLSYLCAG